MCAGSRPCSPSTASAGAALVAGAADAAGDVENDGGVGRTGLASAVGCGPAKLLMTQASSPEAEPVLSDRGKNRVGWGDGVGGWGG